MPGAGEEAGEGAGKGAGPGAAEGAESSPHGFRGHDRPWMRRGLQQSRCLYPGEVQGSLELFLPNPSPRHGTWIQGQDDLQHLTTRSSFLPPPLIPHQNSPHPPPSPPLIHHPQHHFMKNNFMKITRYQARRVKS